MFRPVGLNTTTARPAPPADEAGAARSPARGAWQFARSFPARRNNASAANARIFWPEDDIDRLWKASEQQMTENTLTGKRALMVGFDVDALSALRRDLRALGIAPVVSCPSARQLADVATMRMNIDFLLMNFDVFEDVEDGVDALMAFRLQRPEASVVLVSRAVAGDDLGGERRVICDATLRAPVSADRLRAGLLGAIDNMADREFN
jgi:hypothetical protein